MYQTLYLGLNDVLLTKCNMAAHVNIYHQHFKRIFNHSLFRAPFHGMRFLSNRSGNAKFQDERVQILLKRITGRNLERILTNRRESGVGLPSYRLMTDNEVSMVCGVFF